MITNKNGSILDTINLLLIDEIHTIYEGNRGATLEALITAIKNFQ